MSFYRFAKTVACGFVRLVFRVRYEGVENIPRNQGFILACNHRSVLDPIFIAIKLRQELNFMAKSELFRNPLFGKLIGSLNAFPIRRGQGGDEAAMTRARNIVTSAGALVVFPEGHRSKDGKPLRGRSGVALLSAQTDAPVLPCAIQYGRRLWIGSKVTVKYGQLLTTQELGCDLSSPATIRVGAKLVMDNIVSLLQKGA